MVLAGVGIYEFYKGSIGLILAIVVWILSGTSYLAAFRHNIRLTRLYIRQMRVAKAFDKALTRPNRRSSDARVVDACNRAILEGSFELASAAAVRLFQELAGPEALQEELIHERLPVWPAYLYFQAFRATFDDQIAEDRKLFLEQTFATSHPVWATVAACQLLGTLDQVTDEERVRELTEWIMAVGDRGAAIECTFYQ
jgi:hypothetical protein